MQQQQQQQQQGRRQPVFYAPPTLLGTVLSHRKREQDLALSVRDTIYPRDRMDEMHPFTRVDQGEGEGGSIYQEGGGGGGGSADTDTAHTDDTGRTNSSDDNKTDAAKLARLIDANIQAVENNMFDDTRFNLTLARYIRQLSSEKQIMDSIVMDVQHRHLECARRCRHLAELQKMLGNATQTRRRVLDRVDHRVLRDAHTMSCTLPSSSSSSILRIIEEEDEEDEDDGKRGRTARQTSSAQQDIDRTIDGMMDASLP